MCLPRRRAQPGRAGGEQRPVQVAGEPGPLLRLGLADPLRCPTRQVQTRLGELGMLQLVLTGRLRITPLRHPAAAGLSLEQGPDLALHLVVEARPVLAVSTIHEVRLPAVGRIIRGYREACGYWASTRSSMTRRPRSCSTARWWRLPRRSGSPGASTANGRY